MPQSTNKITLINLEYLFVFGNVNARTNVPHKKPINGNDI